MKKLILLISLVAMATQMTFADELWVKRGDTFYSYYALDSLDRAEQMKGWEWIDTETPETVYVNGGTAKKYASHPNYRVKGNAVYSTTGTLVRILNMAVRRQFDNRSKDDDGNKNKYTDGQINLTKLLVKQDYINNVQGIKNAGKDVIYSLTYRLGMNPQAERDLKAYNKKVARSLMSRNNTFAAIELLKTMSGASDKWSHPRAIQFINERTEIHASEVDIVYKFERLSPTSFKAITLDANGNATHAFKFAFVTNGSFDFKAAMPTVVPLGTFKGTEVRGVKTAQKAATNDDEYDNDN